MTRLFYSGAGLSLPRVEKIKRKLNNFDDRDRRKTRLCDNVFDNALYSSVSKEAIVSSSNTDEVYS